MSHFTLRQFMAAALGIGGMLAAVNAARADITYIGKASIPGTSLDDSGLTRTLEDGSPDNLLGGFGSAISYTGANNLYITTPDRGPSDGTTTYEDRADYFTINVDANAKSVTASLAKTTLLINESGQSFTGSASAFDATGSPASLRLDPEGVRVAANGHFFVSDEYGPYLYEFDQNGKRVRSIPLPGKLLIANPSADGTAELPPGNISGRQSNRGMEGLAISPDGTKLFGIMQSPLIQDGGLDVNNKRVGVNNRIVEVDLTTGKTKEFVYTMSSKSNGVSEIVAVNDHELLVDERDGNAGASAATKKIFSIDLDGATDVSDVASLPTTGLPAGVTAVSKSLFMDLLDPSFGLAGADFPEKIEGLSFGPDLSDGRHLLLVTHDNDLDAANPSNIYAFAIDAANLPGYQAQDFSAAAVPLPPAGLMAIPVMLLAGALGWRARHHAAS